jgi:hypothetical protein
LENWIQSIGGFSQVGRSKLEKATIISLEVMKYIKESDIEEIKLRLGD